MQNLKYDINEPIYETNKMKDTENRLGCQQVGGWESVGLGVWDQQMQTGIYRMAKQQGPTIEHRELHSISCDKSKWKRIQKKGIYIYIYIYKYITESLCCIAVINKTL